MSAPADTRAPLKVELDLLALKQADVVVLAGGVSGEREVSLLSGAEITRALSVDDGRGPAQVRLGGSDEQGRWKGEGLGPRHVIEAVAPGAAKGRPFNSEEQPAPLHGVSRDGTSRAAGARRECGARCRWSSGRRWSRW